MAGQIWVHPAKTRFKLLGKLRNVEIAHDYRRHGSRPSDVIALQCVEQAVDIRLLHPSVILSGIDVAGRRTDHGQSLERLRLSDSGQSADHGTDRVADKVDLLQAEFVDDLQDVLRIAAEGAVAGLVKSGGVRCS